MTIAAPSPPADLDERSTPPPWRGVRQLAIVLCVAVAAAAIGWICWSHIATRRLEPRLNALSAAGEPVLLSDFPRPDVAPQDNAATYWNRASAAMSNTVWCPANSNLTYSDAPPFPKAWLDLSQASETANAGAVQLAEQAARRRQVNWGPRARSQFGFQLATPLPFNSLRSLANQLGDSAVYSHLHGNEPETLRRLDTLLDLADDIDAQDSRLIAYLVSIGIRAAAVNRIEIIAANLQCNETTRPAIEKLLARLDRPMATSLLRTIRFERAVQIEDLAWAEDRQPLLRPMLALSTAASIDESNDACSVAGTVSQPAGLALFGRSRLARSSASTFPLYPPNPFWTNFRLFEVHWRSETEQRMARTLLALHLFEHDHGHWPTTLAELTPTYLKQLPADPYASDGRSLGYVMLTTPTSQQPRPMLYCDQTASATKIPGPPPATPCIGWMQTTGRQWRDVTAWQLPATERQFTTPTRTRPRVGPISR